MTIVAAAAVASAAAAAPSSAVVARARVPPTPSEIVARTQRTEENRIARHADMKNVTKPKLERAFPPKALKHMSAAAHTGRIDARAKLVLALAVRVNIERIGMHTIDQAHARHASSGKSKAAAANSAKPRGFILLRRDYAKATDVLRMPIDVGEAHLAGGTRYVSPATKKRKAESVAAASTSTSTSKRAKVAASAASKSAPPSRAAAAAAAAAAGDSDDDDGINNDNDSE